MPPSSMGRTLDAAAEDLAQGLSRRLATDLRGALDRGELSLHYQPRVALPDARVMGARALLRWQHPCHGNVPPNSFIPLVH
jgi:EAL domain-containing protein (putative c-di-GMP-specific phosphodiesterase class I)